MTKKAIVPADINEKYIPFLYTNFTGVEAMYCGKKIKAVELHPLSSLSKFIRINAIKSDTPLECKNIGFFFLVNQNKISGSIYSHVGAKYNFLKLPDEFTKDLNRLIRDLFEVTFFSFMNGYLAGVEKREHISNGIKKFMELYELDESKSINFSSLHQDYYRKKDKESLDSFNKPHFYKG